MPDRDCLVLRQVKLALYGQESVDVSLVRELGGVVLDVHGGRGGATQVLLLACHNRVSFKIIESSRLPSLTRATKINLSMSMRMDLWDQRTSRN